MLECVLVIIVHFGVRFWISDMGFSRVIYFGNWWENHWSYGTCFNWRFEFSRSFLGSGIGICCGSDFSFRGFILVEALGSSVVIFCVVIWVLVISSFSFVCCSVLWISTECKFFSCSWNFGQSFDSNWCYSIVSVHLHIGLHYFPSFKKVMSLYIWFSSFPLLSFSGTYYKISKMWNGFLGTNFLCVVWVSLVPLFPYVRCLLQLSMWCPYLWHLKHLKGAGIYCFTLLKQYLIFIS